jgi:hypothetical protein
VHRDDQTIDAPGMPFAHRRHDVARVVHHLTRAEPADPGLVLMQSRRDDPGAAGRGELHRVRTDAARRAHDQHDVALGCLDRLHAMERGDGREPDARRPLEVEVPRLVDDEAVRGTATDSAYAPRHRWGSVGTMPVTSSPTANPVAASPSSSISPA